MALTKLTNRGAQKAVTPDELLGGSLYKGRDGQQVKIGDNVPVGTTHLRYNGQMKRLAKKVSGVLNVVSEYSANIAGKQVNLFNQVGVVGKVYVTDEGAVDDKTVDSTTAIQATLNRYRGTNVAVVFSGDFQITSEIDLSRCIIISEGATIHKNFNGNGVLVDGDAVYTYIYGNLFIDGYGAYKATGFEASTSPNAHGMTISGRCEVNGKVMCRYHQGNGHSINNTNKNMNKCTLLSLWSLWCNGYGHRFSGTRDDCSVWRIATYSQYCYAGGQYVDDNFSGRNWRWFCYNEGTTNAAAPFGVYLGRIRSSNIEIYSEEQVALSADNIHITANSTDNDVTDFRKTRTVNLSESTVIRGPGTKWYYGDTGNVVDSVRCVNLTNNAQKTVTRTIIGSSDEVIAKEQFNGGGGWSMVAQDRDTSTPTRYSGIGCYNARSYAQAWNSNGRLDFMLDSHRGTPDAPLPVNSGDIVSRLLGRVCVNSSGALVNSFAIKGQVLTSPTTSNARSQIRFDVNQSSSDVTTVMTLKDNGVLNTPAGYTPFTGIHVGVSDHNIDKGMAVDIERVERSIVEVFSEDNDGKKTKTDEYESAIPVVSVTKSPMSKVCAGVVDHCVEREDGYYDVYIAAVGDNDTRNLNGFKVCNEGGDILAGDILCTSSTEGVLMKAPDNIHMSVVTFKSMEPFSGKEVGVVYGYF